MAIAAVIVAVLCVAVPTGIGATGAIGALTREAAAARKREAANVRVTVDAATASLLARPLDTTHRLPVFAHRGFVRDGKLGNSFQSFSAARDAGCPQVELDIRTSRDGVFYISHDATLINTAGINKRIDSMDSDELDQVTMLDGERMHRLEELFERYGTSMYYLVEFKENNASVNAFYNLMARYPKVVDHVEVHSFYGGVLKRLDRIMPNMFKQLLVGHGSALTKHLHDDWLDSIAVAKHMATDRNIARVHDAGKEIWSWTLERPSNAREELGAGVDGVISNIDPAGRITCDARVWWPLGKVGSQPAGLAGSC